MEMILLRSVQSMTTIREEVVRFLIGTTTGVVVVVYAFGLEEESPRLGSLESRAMFRTER
jgi:hypothetical protein